MDILFCIFYFGFGKILGSCFLMVLVSAGTEVLDLKRLISSKKKMFAYRLRSALYEKKSCRSYFRAYWIKPHL